MTLQLAVPIMPVVTINQSFSPKHFQKTSSVFGSSRQLDVTSCEASDFKGSIGIAPKPFNKTSPKMTPELLSYIDPMSGAMVLQVIIAGIAGALTYFRRTIFGAVKSIFGRKSEDSPAA